MKDNADLINIIGCGGAGLEQGGDTRQLDAKGRVEWAEQRLRGDGRQAQCDEIRREQGDSRLSAVEGVEPMG